MTYSETVKTICRQRGWLSFAIGEQKDRIFTACDDNRFDEGDIASMIWLCSPGTELSEIYDAITGVEICMQ